VEDSLVPLSLGLDLLNNKPPFDLLHFTVSEVENALLELESSKDSFYR
jgi:hypothetical protein